MAFPPHRSCLCFHLPVTFFGLNLKKRVKHTKSHISVSGLQKQQGKMQGAQQQKTGDAFSRLISRSEQQAANTHSTGEEKNWFSLNFLFTDPREGKVF